MDRMETIKTSIVRHLCKPGELTSLKGTNSPALNMLERAKAFKGRMYTRKDLCASAEHVHVSKGITSQQGLIGHCTIDEGYRSF